MLLIMIMIKIKSRMIVRIERASCKVPLSERSHTRYANYHYLLFGCRLLVVLLVGADLGSVKGAIRTAGEFPVEDRPYG